jgi:hypothetical protein
MKLLRRRILHLGVLLVSALTMACNLAVADVEIPLQNIPSDYAKAAAAFPSLALEVHKIGRMGLSVTNNGFFGAGYFRNRPPDPETGIRAMSCEYPINSNTEYLWTAALWFGAVVGRDTLVSIGAGMYYWNKELWPDGGEKAVMIRRSSQPFSIHYSPEAVSEEDIIAHYTDTVTNSSIIRDDPIDNRPHRPLNLEITQKSYAWSYPYAEDFVLLDFEIRNIGRFPIKQLYVGVVVEAIVYHRSKSDADETWQDDICGFKRIIPSPIWPGEYDTVNVAWVADNDGDPVEHHFDNTSPTSVTATRVIRTPSDSLEYSFNWWVTHFSTSLDWGPRQVTDEKPFRDLGSTFGSALGAGNSITTSLNAPFRTAPKTGWGLTATPPIMPTVKIPFIFSVLAPSMSISARPCRLRWPILPARIFTTILWRSTKNSTLITRRSIRTSLISAIWD